MVDPTAEGFSAIVARVLAAVPVGTRALVAIDGVGASGKTTFAARLAQCIDLRPVVVLHVDDFFHPAAVRHARGRLSPEGFWLDAYDDEALVCCALTPLLARGDGLYRSASYDRAGDAVVEPAPRRAARDALVVDNTDVDHPRITDADATSAARS